uniref:Activating signal cointegrator 1 n=1 Tax=Noccaea caerulescens TaxID=107243 RepID=A0A1J3GJQ2_NOCCA
MRRGNYTNPCLTMHQPWASLLVHGIKRIEGRSWPAPIRGRLWIHAASKVPDESTIKAMEEFYQEIYGVDGITDIQFPQHYPVSRLIGCVEVVGCVSCDELQNWQALSQGVRLEGQTNFCWLCEQPQKLIIPFEMRGYQGVYNLENKIHVAAARGLTPPSQSPYAVKFPLPDPKDPFSLKPGSISFTIQEEKAVETEQITTTLTAAIAGARAAATQFSNKGQSPHPQTNNYITRSKSKGIEGCSGSSSKVEDDTKLTVESDKTSAAAKREERNTSVGVTRFDPGAARIMAAAIRNLKPSS